MSFAHTLLPLHFLGWEEAIILMRLGKKRKKWSWRSILCATPKIQMSLCFDQNWPQICISKIGPICSFHQHFHVISHPFHIQFLGGVYFAKYGRHQAKAPGQLWRGRNEVLFLLNFLHSVCLCLSSEPNPHHPSLLHHPNPDYYSSSKSSSR